MNKVVNIKISSILMRINILTTLGNGRCGIGTYTKYLSHEQKKLGHDINFYFIEPTKVHLIDFIKIANSIVQNCDIIHIQFDYSLFGKILGMTGIGVIVVYPIIYLLSLMRKCKIVTTMHEVWDFRSPPKFGIIGSIYAIILNYIIFKCSDTIIVLSDNAYQTVKAQNIRVKQLFKIPHGLQTPKKYDKTISRMHFGLNQDSIIIMQFGFISETKGQDILIEASQRLPPNYTTIIAGSCKTPQDQKYFNSLKDKTQSNVIFYGFINEEDLPLLFSAVDIVVLPYRRITQSGVLNLSLSFLIPTITSDLPYFKEINNQFNCLLLFESENPKALADSITKIIQNEEIFHQMRENMQRYVQMNTYQTIAREIDRIYLNCGV